MRKIIFGKKGDAVTGTIERAFEVVLPFLAFLAILYVIWSVGSDRTAQTYFQTVEFANIIDSTMSFDGQLRLKYIPIEKDFEFKFTDSSFSTKIKNDEANAQKSIHIPQKVFIDNRMDLAVGGVVRQVQFLKTDGGFGIGAITASSLSTHVYKRDQLLCPSDKQKQEGSVVYTAENRPADLSDAPLKITGTSLVYLDMTQLVIVDPEAKMDLERDLAGLPITQNIDEANINIAIRVKESQTSSILIFTSSHSSATQLGCNLVNEFAANDRANNDERIRASIVPIEFNPYSSQVITNKPYVVIEVFYTRTTGETAPVSKYSTLISKAIKDAYAQVYNE